jgi:dihydrofolate reductase
MRLSIIVAKAENGVIGSQNKLPWHLGDDLKKFKELTTGHHILMGRKTFESLGKPLPGRMHLIVSSQNKEASEQVLWFNSLFRAIKFAERQGEKELFIIGGAQIYKAALPLIDRIYLTDINAVVAGDTLFPPISLKNYKLMNEQSFLKSSTNDYDFTFKVLDRKKY